MARKPKVVVVRSGHSYRICNSKSTLPMDADHQRQASIRAQAKRDRQLPGAVSLADMLAWEHEHGDSPGRSVGTNYGRGWIVEEEGEEGCTTCSGMFDDVFAAVH